MGNIMFLWNDRPKWEKAQAILHKKENGRFEMENTYGRLRYSKKSPGKMRGRPREKKGFVLEAKEAPGTLGHAEDEKRFKPDKMKKVSMKDERFCMPPERLSKTRRFFMIFRNMKEAGNFWIV